MGLLLPLAFLLSAGAGAQADSGPGNPLVGTWQLLRYVDTADGGDPVHPFGDPPLGLFVFTADGHVSISIMRNPPAVSEASTDSDPDACVPAWYCSYFGTYRYDPSGPSWTTHVIGGNIPTYIGTDQSRSFAISGEVLIISETYTAGGRTFQAQRVLRRINP